MGNVALAVETEATCESEMQTSVTRVSLAAATIKCLICEQQVGPTLIPQWDTIPPG